MKRLLRLLALTPLFLTGGMAQAQITVQTPENVTYTKATFSATFPASSTGNSFQIKTGTLTEIDDFSKMALDKDSDPVKIETSGSYAWKTRDVKGWVESYNKLSNNGRSDMTATATFTTDTKLTFEWSVDSEENYGILEFYVDNVKQKEITGLVEFSKVEIDVTEGEHTFKWSYTKKSNTNVGLDLGMVRNIKFQDTTPGEWITKPAAGSTLTLDNLMPNNSYLMRAISDTEASKVVEFKTKDITITPIKIDPITQTTATFNTTAEYGVSS